MWGGGSFRTYEQHQQPSNKDFIRIRHWWDDWKHRQKIAWRDGWKNWPILIVLLVVLLVLLLVLLVVLVVVLLVPPAVKVVAFLRKLRNMV